ncbi:hypothetical protein ABKY47_004546, partial [Aeromonas hydrophila]
RLVASISGRLRIKLEGVSVSKLKRCQQCIDALPDVTGTLLRVDASSLVVFYLASLSQAAMEQQVLTLCRELTCVPSELAPAPSPAPVRTRSHRAVWRRRANRTAKVVGITALPLSIALVYAGNKHLHAMTGWLFVTALAVHLFIHRKNVLR